MFVGPGCVSASLMNHAEYAVGADEIPGLNGVASIGWVADKAVVIDRGDASVGQGCAGGASVHFRLVDVDALFIFGGGPCGSRACGAGAGADTVAGSFLGSVVVPGISDVVVNAGEGGASAGNDCGEAGKRIGGFGGASGDIVDAILAEGGQGRAVGLPIVHGADAIGAVREVNGVH